MNKRIFKKIKKELGDEAIKRVIYHELRAVLRLAIGAIMLGGIIKEDWLKSNILVWILFLLFAFLLVWFGKKEKEKEN